MTQEALAELASLNYKYIGRVELGKADPGADVLVRLARALRVPVGELFETITPASSLPTWPRPGQADEVSAALRALTDALERLFAHKPPPLSTRAPRRSSR
jgi:transcriptional regulator with XRE-family HTH domain